MPLLTTVRDAACLHLKTAIPDALRVEAFTSFLDFDALSKRGMQFSERASLFVAAGACENSGPVLDCEATFWVFAVSRHAARPTVASSSALDMIQKAALALHGQTFGLGSPAIVRQIGPIASEELDAAGFQVWQLSFTMRISFAEDAQ